MSEDSTKALETAMARIAQLEAEVSRSRSEAKKPVFDQAAFARQFATDPVGSLSKMGVPLEHTTRVLVAHALGDQAPPELKVLAAMGPQVSATSALSSTVEQLRQRLDGYEAKERRQSVQALAQDKQKYPHLAKALVADPSLADDIDRHGGSAEEYAQGLEGRLAKVAAALTPAVSTNTDQPAQSSQSKAQVTTAPPTGDPTPPPLPRPAGVWSEEEHRRIRDEVIRKHTSRRVE